MNHRPIILLYHRVIDLAVDPQLLAVSPVHFREHLSVLRETCAPMSLAAMLESLRSGDSPDRAVVVTFDDGYADNLEFAAPILSRYDVPATVYVTPADDENPRPFWWDELERLVLASPNPPPGFAISIEGTEIAWRVDGGPLDAPVPDWNVNRPAVAGSREGVYLKLCELLRPLASCERDRVVERLGRLLGAAPATSAPHQRLSSAEIVRLIDEAPIEIGAHTLTHPVLAVLSPAEQRREIEGSRQRLERMTGRPIESFAYPFGTRRDYDDRTVSIVRDCGFSTACANFAGCVGRKVDPFQLPRFIVRDWDGDRFARKLDEWRRER